MVNIQCRRLGKVLAISFLCWLVIAALTLLYWNVIPAWLRLWQLAVVATSCSLVWESGIFRKAKDLKKLKSSLMYLAASNMAFYVWVLQFRGAIWLGLLSLCLGAFQLSLVGYRGAPPISGPPKPKRKN